MVFQISQLILFVYIDVLDENEPEALTVVSIMSLNFVSGNRMDAAPHNCEG